MRLQYGTLLALITALLAVANASGGDMLEEGAVFPEFRLMNHRNELVSSSDLDGKAYLLYFYPKADTPG